MRKSIRKGELLSTDDAEHSAVFCLSTSALDRDGETVDPSGGDFTEYERNPVVLFNHDVDDFPIGRSDKLWVGEVKGQPALLGKVVFSQANPKGQLAYQMVKEGTLKGCSISFLPTGRVERNRSGGNHYGSWKLLEWSVCPVGSNPDAVRLAHKRLKAVEKDITFQHAGHSWTLREVPKPSMWGGPPGNMWAAFRNGRAEHIAPSREQLEGMLREYGPAKQPPAERGVRMNRQLWVRGKSAWLLKAEGDPDDATQQYLADRGLDDVRLEDTPPPEGAGFEEVAAAVGEAVGEAVAAVLAGNGEAAPPAEGEQKQQPSDEIPAADACAILEEGVLHGEPLTEDQRGLFGAACARARSFKRCPACRSRKWLCPSCTSVLRKRLMKAMSGDEFQRRVEELQRLRNEGQISQQEFERQMEQVHREYMGIDGKARKQESGDRSQESEEDADSALTPDSRPLTPDDDNAEPPPEEEQQPPGRRALERWIGAIQEDLPGLEQPAVLAAADKALAAFQAALGKAYGEGEEPDPLLDEAQEKKLADAVERLEQREARNRELLFRASGRRL